MSKKVKTKTLISKKGYGVYLDSISKNDLKELEKALTVKPSVLTDYDFGSDTTFPVYRLSDTRIYLPKFYGLKKYGDTKNVVKDGVDVVLNFNGQLKEHQVDFCNKVLKELKTNNSCIAVSATGSGKCHAIDTPILMFDGSIKMVQDIIIGDQLMGDDSTPRKVLNLGTGEDVMYEIVPNKGESFTVNSDHILCLKCTGALKVSYAKTYKLKWKAEIFNNKKIKIESKYFNTEIEAKKYLEKFDKESTICEISIKSYLNLPDYIKKKLTLYRVSVEFTPKEIPFDPYIIGLWLGDGTSANSIITNQDAEVIIYLFKKLPEYEMYLHYDFGYSYRISDSKNRNKFTRILRDLNLLNNKHIPDLYKINSRKIRLELLAGLLDSDGHLQKNCYQFVQKNESIANNVVYLARSLGFSANKHKRNKEFIYKGILKKTFCFVILISGDIYEIPCKIKRKQATPRNDFHKGQQLKKNVSNLSFKVIEKSRDNYYGFELDNNGRYLLGNFIVTHNTAMALWLTSQIKKRTLIIVHKSFLLEQWKERIAQFLPNASIGIIQQDKCEIENKDIIIGMIQTITKREYPDDTFKSIQLTVFDEVHHCSAQGFSNIFYKIGSKLTLGLSANIKRTDGLTKVIEWFLGSVICNEIISEIEKPSIKFIEAEYSTKITPKFNFKGNLNSPDMINQLVVDSARNQLIINEILDLNKEGRKILVLSGRRGHCEYLAEQLIKNNIITGLYLGGMSNEHLEESNKKQVVIATYSMASEAYDNPDLDTLVMATGISNIIQSIGRILRKKNKFNPLVIDICDIQFFGNQARRRKQFYKKSGYIILKNDTKEDNESDNETNDKIVECLFD
jgi:superfamily II DNA or RNA helicase